MVDIKLFDLIKDIAIEEIEIMNKGKIKYELVIELATRNALVLSNNKDFDKKKIFRKNINKMYFKIYYSEIKSEEKELLKKILYTPNRINFKQIENKYEISEDMSFFILSVLHEFGHMYDIIDDVKTYKCLKRAKIDDLEYMTYKMTRCLFDSKEEQAKQYRLLGAEKFADDFSIMVFIKNLNKINKYMKG